MEKIITKTQKGYQIYNSKAKYSLDNAAQAIAEASLILKSINKKLGIQ